MDCHLYFSWMHYLFQVISAVSIPYPALTAFYLDYCVETFISANMTLHAFLPLSLLKVRLPVNMLEIPTMCFAAFPAQHMVYGFFCGLLSLV